MRHGRKSSSKPELLYSGLERRKKSSSRDQGPEVVGLVPEGKEGSLPELKVETTGSIVPNAEYANLDETGKVCKKKAPGISKGRVQRSSGDAQMKTGLSLTDYLAGRGGGGSGGTQRGEKEVGGG